jgi:hypothetical protein
MWVHGPVAGTVVGTDLSRANDGGSSSLGCIAFPVAAAVLNTTGPWSPCSRLLHSFSPHADGEGF